MRTLELTELDLELYGSEVTPDTFPLPTLGPKLQQVAVDIHTGRGFGVVRGIEPDDFSPEENVIIFLGISSYIGARRGRQDEDGNMLSGFIPRLGIRGSWLTDHSAHSGCQTLDNAARRSPYSIFIQGIGKSPQ